LKPIAFFLGYDDVVSLVAIWLCSLGNTVGRIVGGFSHDRFKASSIKAILIAVAVSSLLFVMGDVGKISFWAMVAIAGLCYGALISNIPAHVSTEYGHENFGRVYPLIFLVHGLAALLISPLAGCIFDHYKTYRPAMVMAGGIALLCFAGFVLAYRHSNQQELTVNRN
jgi:MFS family permease